MYTDWQKHAHTKETNGVFIYCNVETWEWNLVVHCEYAHVTKQYLPKHTSHVSINKTKCFRTQLLIVVDYWEASWCEQVIEYSNTLIDDSQWWGMLAWEVQTRLAVKCKKTFG